jgi:hypothetical protein
VIPDHQLCHHIECYNHILTMMNRDRWKHLSAWGPAVDDDATTHLQVEVRGSHQAVHSLAFVYTTTLFVLEVWFPLQ